MKRLVFVTGLAAGFLLGARAGRARYDQIATALRSAADRPDVQAAAGTVSGQVRAALNRLR